MAIPGAKVRYGKISNAIDLFDDGYTSAVWCSYGGNSQRCLGVRYNGAEGAESFPNKNGYPLWYIEPEFVTRSILLDLLTAINNDASVGNLQHVLAALREFNARQNPPAAEPNPEART
jgi:hypothetical protein